MTSSNERMTDKLFMSRNQIRDHGIIHFMNVSSSTLVVLIKRL